MFESTEQRICDQARAIRKNGWLSPLELEAITRQLEDEFQVEFGENAATEVETVENEDMAENEDMVENETESVVEEIVNVEEVNNNVTDSVDDTIMLLMLNYVNDRVNDAVKYFKSKNIIETNDLIKAASVWVAEQIELKKRDYREKKNLDGKTELKKIRRRRTNLTRRRLADKDET